MQDSWFDAAPDGCDIALLRLCHYTDDFLKRIDEPMHMIRHNRMSHSMSNALVLLSFLLRYIKELVKVPLHQQRAPLFAPLARAAVRLAPDAPLDGLLRRLRESLDHQHMRPPLFT